MPKVKYLVSSPRGDLHVDKSLWHLPLDGDPAKTPYRTYFLCVREFLLKHGLQAAGRAMGKKIYLDDVAEIIIRSEKHGALYHPASIEVGLERERIKFCLNVAVTSLGKKSLQREFSILKLLRRKFALPYLPRPYFIGEYNSMLFLLEEWFEGFHEFHLSTDPDGRQILNLWDFDRGPRIMTVKQWIEIYRNIAGILTLYYDFDDSSQIHPWRHEAGDFVVKAAGLEKAQEKIEVRLTTARDYGPVVNCANPVIGLFCFFLNMTIRMRLDRRDGVSEMMWADDMCLNAVVNGFFDGLKSKQKLNHTAPETGDVLNLLQAFSIDEWRNAGSNLVAEVFAQEESDLITKNLPDHATSLHAALKAFSLENIREMDHQLSGKNN